MLFKEALQTAVNGSQSYAGILMDFEGIPVDSYVSAHSPFDIEVVGAEVSVLVKQIQRAVDMLEAGGTEEVSFTSEKLTTVVRIIDRNYFLAILLAPDGNAGKARFALRVLAPKLKTELS